MKCSNCDTDHNVRECAWCERPICQCCTKMFVHTGKHERWVICPECVKIECAFNLTEKDIRTLYKERIKRVNKEIRQACKDRWYRAASEKKAKENVRE